MLKTINVYYQFKLELKPLLKIKPQDILFLINMGPILHVPKKLNYGPCAERSVSKYN